ncbi:glycosyltransferase family 4 protein [Lacibacterium aquatile]|uniref:Glycosyltransferase family 4 protein n=1 Tax=Lacibacterium aquatile TaxID=1168082 RepID=A0ABW5DTV4_9PROT
MRIKASPWFYGLRPYYRMAGRDGNLFVEEGFHLIAQPDISSRLFKGGMNMKKKPHIVSIVFNRIQGDSRVIKTAQAAINAGYDATIIGVSKDSSTQRREIEGVPVVLLPNFGKQLERYGLWGEERDLRLLIGGFMRTVLNEIISLRPDIVHSHDMFCLRLGASMRDALIAAGRNVPWVHDLHEYVAGLTSEAEAYMTVCLGWERNNLHFADHLFTVSDALADILKHRYALDQAPTITYNSPFAGAFQTSGTDVRSAVGVPAGAPLVVFVGGAKPLRGCDAILDAVSRLKDVHLVFVSQGKYIDQLVARGKAQGMTGRIHTHPYVPSDQVTSFIRTADVGIHGMLHYPNGEVALPNKLFEYLHADLPVVVSDVASMKAFVETHGVGVTFIADDAESCAAAISDALNRKDELRARITNTLKQTYSWEEQEKKVQAVYAKLLATPRAAPTADEREKAMMRDKAEATLFEAAYARALSEACVRDNIDARTQKKKITKSAPSTFAKVYNVAKRLYKSVKRG